MNAKYGGEKITCTQLDSVEEVLKAGDIVSLHTVLDETTTGMIDKAALEMMKSDAVLVNSSRGPIINETDLVTHLQANPDFRCGALHIGMHPSGSRTTVLLRTTMHDHTCLTRLDAPL
jgi:lactate dehydrogenase-like 2-hydroxyacid dehydrogenase